jgi:hypothetical protein
MKPKNAALEVGKISPAVLILMEARESTAYTVAELLDEKGNRYHLPAN